MITYRLRGLLNLHIGASTALAGLLFLVMAINANNLPGLRLSAQVNISLYFLCVIVGMLFSARKVTGLATRFHRLSWVDSARLSSRQVVYVALAIFGAMAASKDAAVSRVFLGAFLLTLTIGLLVLNLGLPRFLSRLMFQRHHELPTLFIGNASTLLTLDQWLESKKVLGMRPVGFVSDSSIEEPTSAFPYPLLGTLDDLERVIDDKMVAQVVVLDLPFSPDRARFLMETCQEAGTRVLIYNNLSERLQFPLVGVADEGHQFFTAQEEPLEDPINRMVKRAFDIAISAPVVFFLLPPITVLVLIMQKLQSPGRIFFAQPRAGHRRNEFRMMKYRSMYDVQRSLKDEAVQAKKGDARIYPFGRILRRTSLDEFPQFINVLKGDMSIVGPRPHMLVHDEEFAKFFKGYRTRHFAKPGITGLAQVRGYRGEISEHALLHRRVQCDIEYITNWSIWLDIQIVFKTFWHVFFPPSTAY